MSASRWPKAFGADAFGRVAEVDEEVGGVLDVSAEGGKFVRRIVRGPFHDTKEVDYCDPQGHDD